MVSLVTRPLFVFLTLAMIVLAFFQVSGRLLFAVLDEMEIGINQWLAPQQILIQGLEGDWRRINPVIRIESISLPAGELNGLLNHAAAIIGGHLHGEWIGCNHVSNFNGTRFYRVHSSGNAAFEQNRRIGGNATNDSHLW